MRRNFFLIAIIPVMIGLFSFAFASNVNAASVYGALYEAANLTATDGENSESVLMYYPDADGFIAATTNDDGVEWWTSDALGITWTLSETNPLEEYNCRQIGRHSPELYEEDFYFAASCNGDGTEGKAHVFKLTGIDTVELQHVYETAETASIAVEDGEDGNEPPPDDDGNAGNGGAEALAIQYPTATIVNDLLIMFFNGGFSKFDGTTWTDVTDADNQPENGVPLEASSAIDDLVYLAFTSGEVMSFDGESYTVIEDVNEALSGSLPSVEVYNGKVYVGNQDGENGATLFQYDPENPDAGWTKLTALDSENQIINKMELSDEIDGKQYLVYYTSNSTVGTNIIAVDADDTQIDLIDAGLGGTNPENNREVVSVAKRTVTDAGKERQVMLFGTQNTEDQSKIFVLMLDNDLAFTPKSSAIESSSVKTSNARKISAAKTGKTAKGRVFTIKVPASKVRKGDKFYLYIDGTVVNTVTVKKKKAIFLKYTDAKTLSVGDTFTARVGRQLAYGSGDDQLLSENIVLGSKLKVTVRKSAKK